MPEIVSKAERSTKISHVKDIWQPRYLVNVSPPWRYVHGLRRAPPVMAIWLLIGEVIRRIREI